MCSSDLAVWVPGGIEHEIRMVGPVSMRTLYVEPEAARFMPGTHCAVVEVSPLLRELILAIRAIWDTWENGTPLAFRGDFYTHTLMTPFFTPDRADLAGFGVPKIFLAGVGELMTEVAGEVCDGFICHGFTTDRKSTRLNSSH